MDPRLPERISTKGIYKEYERTKRVIHEGARRTTKGHEAIRRGFTNGHQRNPRRNKREISTKGQKEPPINTEPFAKFVSQQDLLPGRIVIPGSAGVPPAPDLAGRWRLASQTWSVHRMTGTGQQLYKNAGGTPALPGGGNQRPARCRSIQSLQIMTVAPHCHARLRILQKAPRIDTKTDGPPSTTSGTHMLLQFCALGVTMSLDEGFLVLPVLGGYLFPLRVFFRGPSRTAFESFPTPWSSFANQSFCALVSFLAPLPDLWRIPLEPSLTP